MISKVAEVLLPEFQIATPGTHWQFVVVALNCKPIFSPFTLNINWAGFEGFTDVKFIESV